ncbi:uncharacterized protein LOC123307331 isoform X2 [Coccinella septempunctata]|uniref:uncharacterized protein LOC123307331 isoform X2 n=1 Tax=Coccinella septempunctata TaxID=41139 RepID=UPI001D0618B2|nr:uncharacterized protein LOC123307331 isoform X2 [Coccinella septempunctata]
MGSDLFEVKAMLRSILISSPVVLNVSELDNDFREQEGIGIPFGKLGYKSLLEFLRSIPDVLLVKGDSKFSEIVLIESEKSSHVNNLVMKQKSSCKRGNFFSKRRKSARSQGVSTKNCKIPTYTTSDSAVKGRSHNEENIRHDDGYSSQISGVNSNKNTNRTAYETDSLQNNSTNTNMRSASQKQSANGKTPPKDDKFKFNQMKSIPSKHSTHEKIHTNNNEFKFTEMKTTVPKNSSSIYSKAQRLISEKKEVENFPTKRGTQRFSSHKTVKESSHLINRTKRKDCSLIELSSPSPDNFPIIDVSLRVSKKQENKSYWSGGVIRKSIEKNNTFEYCSEAENSSERNNRSGWSTGSGDLMHSLLKKKSKLIEKNERNNENRIHRKVKNFIPKNVQCNLQKLISGFPDGIWCSELPVAYKNLMGKELCFENYGYRCLIYMCFDLEDIFHCVKESPSDYKLYDARTPMPKYTEEEESFEEPTSPEPIAAIPDMKWGSFDTFLPEDAIKLGFKIERLQACDVLEVGMSVSVIVGEIYDISKFWIILDNLNLEYLMRDMQCFYQDNYQRYLVPRSLLVEGLHCVVLYRDKFHRAVILNAMPDEEFLKVYYFDYGTLAKVSKSEVWFLTTAFSELPSQAIRSRLSDIYPPHKGVTWSPYANHEFSRRTCMKKLTAEIGRVDKIKNLADIKLRNSEFYISDILVDLKYAIYINQSQEKHIEDPNCKSRVQFIHLFPTFDEIENWVVPSLEEASDFLNTSVTADFLFSQYFSRISHEDLIDSIEEKMEITSKKKKSLTKSFKPEELLTVQSTDEMNKMAYGVLYVSETTTEDCGKDIKKSCGYDEQNEFMSKRIIDIDNDEVLIGILRQTRMKKSLSLDKNQYVSESIFDKSSINSSLQSKGMVKEEQNSIFSDFVKKHPSRHEKVLKEFSNLAELEKYLSEDSSSKKSSSNLIDLDVELSSPVVSTTNLFMNIELQTNLTTLERNEDKDQKCLLSSYNDFDQSTLENPLDFPIPDIPLPDLIRFDEEPCFAVTSTSDPQEGSQSTKLIFDVCGSDFGDADDEDSDEKLKSIESCQSKVSTYESQSMNSNDDSSNSNSHQENSVQKNDFNMESSERKYMTDTFSSFRFNEDSVLTEHDRLEMLENQTSSNISVETIKPYHKNTYHTDHNHQNEVGYHDPAPIIPNYAAEESVQNIFNKSQTNSAANLSHFCQPKDSNVHDLSDTISDFNNLNINNGKLNTSTPILNQIALTEDKNTLDEFDVLHHCPTSNPTLYSKDEAAVSRLSFVPGECMTQESRTSQCEADCSGSIYCKSAKQVPIEEVNSINEVNGADVSYSNSTLHHTSDVASQFVIYENTIGFTSSDFVPNNIVHPMISHVQTQAFRGPQNMLQPRTMMVRPPPGFMPILPYGHPSSLHPFGTQYSYVNPINVPSIPGHFLSIQQQEILSRSYNNHPIVIFNYNFLPHSDSTSTTQEK